MTPNIDCLWLQAHLRFSTYFYIVIIAYFIFNDTHTKSASYLHFWYHIKWKCLLDWLQQFNAYTWQEDQTRPWEQKTFPQVADLTQNEGHREKRQGTISKKQMKQMRLHTDLDQIPILCRFRSKALHLQFQIKNFILVLGSFLQTSSN